MERIIQEMKCAVCGEGGYNITKKDTAYYHLCCDKCGDEKLLPIPDFVPVSNT